MTHPTQPHPSDQPKPGCRPTLTEADPAGVYQCNRKGGTTAQGVILRWDGEHLYSVGHFDYRCDVADYTDFHGPLTVQAEGWEEVVGWLSSICMWFEAELKDHVMGTPKTIDAWKMHSLLLEARAALAKLAAAEPTDAPREN